MDTPKRALPRKRAPYPADIIAAAYNVATKTP